MLRIYIITYIFVLLHLIGTIFTMKQGSTKYLPWARNFAPLTTRASCHHTSLARKIGLPPWGKGGNIEYHRITWSSASPPSHHQSRPWHRVRGGGSQKLQHILYHIFHLKPSKMSLVSGLSHNFPGNDHIPSASSCRLMIWVEMHQVLSWMIPNRLYSMESVCQKIWMQFLHGRICRSLTTT